MIRLSYSALKELSNCERRFQLNRLLTPSPDINETGANPSFIFGHSYEEGCISYFQNQNKEQAIFNAWLRWHFFSETEGYSFPHDQKRTFWICMDVLKKTFHLIDDLLMDHEIAIFNGKPAIQLSFRINISKEYYYVGYVDFVLFNKYTKKYSIWDCKTTALTLQDLSPIYLNSIQLISYSIVLDAIVGPDCATYDVSYLTAQIGAIEKKVKIYTFPKTLKDRLDFFISLGFDISRIDQMREMGIFPRREQGCLSYNRPCYFLGFCNMHSMDAYPREEEKDETEYQFIFDLQTLINNHLERIGNGTS